MINVYASESAKRFSYEWERYNKIVPDYETQFLRWVHPLTKENFKGKTVLDAGCGNGRNLYWAITYGAAEAVGIDVDERTAAVARKNLGNSGNVNILCKSIYDIDWKNKFDISMSIGVIHHLKEPSAAVRKLADATKKGGKVLIWVYGREGNEGLLKIITPARAVTSRMPIKLCWLTAFLFSAPLYVSVKIFPQTNSYLKMLKSFKFSHIHSIVFDQLLPRIARYYKKAEVEALMRQADLRNIQISHINDKSWTAIGTK